MKKFFIEYVAEKFWGVLSVNKNKHYPTLSIHLDRDSLKTPNFLLTLLFFMHNMGQNEIAPVELTPVFLFFYITYFSEPRATTAIVPFVPSDPKS